jgi:hypothetical protein
MEISRRAGETEPPDEVGAALERLAAARKSLARAEEEFATYCRQLAAFAKDYGRHVGEACEELDRLSAQLAAVIAERFSQGIRQLPPTPRPAAAGPTTAAVTAIALSLRDLYRTAARRYHPDLARNAADRQWRAAMMRRVNAAFEAEDSATLQQLLDQPAATQLAPSSPLAAIEFEFGQVQARLADVTAAREQMAASEIGQLHAQVTSDGQDPIVFLRRLAAAVRTEILEKSALLAELTSPEPPQ